ncbi:glycoside hydrolase family 3 protein [Sphingosinicella terrae]|uniref:glycoside hydrolase family 3 protein n=1 Tax=Sphingosinicella terrae TaxID=2172047 RepID=UPI000E0CDDEF|nr:exo 1,3/1,4-beta-D-glucan glucohydrolase [Sphingosinicella terrae]
MLNRAVLLVGLLSTVSFAATAQTTTNAAPAAPAAATAPEAAWPRVTSRVAADPAVERRIDDMLQRMTLEQKVAQIVQPDIASITPEEYRQYRFGSILAGGNSSPGGVETAPAAEWLALADAFWDASMDGPEDGLRIPVMWGIDAVHGHANVVGATIFPQNIGLGATRNPELIRRIGEVTAIEMAVTGIDWDFSPTLAVVRDDRWGRTYEGFSEDPEIVRSFAGAIVEGLQGRPGTPEFLGPGRVIATAKHFVGDGGTENGRDQGDNPSAPEALRDIHGAGYPPAIEAGVQALMASFSSVRGEKVHGSRDLLTGAIRDQMGFDGLVVGDWNAHGQVEGCTNTSCPQSFNAGLDMFMAPDSWRDLYRNTLAQVRDGTIPMARLDEAVRRILRVKIRAGLFEEVRPSQRPYAGRFELLGSADHRAVARQAVRESLVLLKNQGHLLPLRPGANVLVTGDGADNIARQSGGWTITWQGTGVTNEHFPNAQSIFAGISETVSAAGGTATLSVDGRYSGRPDVAIVVFGEDPYAEFVGDRQTLEFSPADKNHLDTMRRLRADGIPVVAVFLSGRPMWVNPEINAADAFVAAFLPGSEGGGIADVLFANADGSVRNDFRGRLSFSWPRRADQTPLNRGDADYDPLFAYGHGLSYADNGDVAPLSEERPQGLATEAGALFVRGRIAPGLAFAADDRVQMRGVDRRAQEDARSFRWTGAGTASLQSATPLDLSREAIGELSLIFDYRVDAAPAGEVLLGMACGESCGATVPIAGALRAAPVGEWRTLVVPLRCFARGGTEMNRLAAPWTLTSRGALGLSVSDIRVASAAVNQDQCGQP